MVTLYTSHYPNMTVYETESAILSYKIRHKFNEPAEASIILSDPFGDLFEKYSSQGNVLSLAYQADGAVFTDDSTDALDDGANDMELTAATATFDDAYFFGLTSSNVNGLRLNIGQEAITDRLTISWQYYDGDSYTNFADVTDGTNGLQNAGINTVTWTTPTDWETSTVDGNAGYYWVKMKVTNPLQEDFSGGGEQRPLGTQAWAFDSYISHGRVNIYDDDNDDGTAESIQFDGRIMKVLYNPDKGTTELICQDWLSQLNDKQINYDMREDLDGSGLRESELKGYTSDKGLCVWSNGGVYYAIDGDMSWADDEFVNDFMIVSGDMSGDLTITIFPHSATVAQVGGGGIEDGSGGWGDLWVNDINSHYMTDNDSDWTVTYEFEGDVFEGSLFNSFDPTNSYLVVEYDSTNTIYITSKYWNQEGENAVYLFPTLEDTDGERKRMEIPLTYTTASNFEEDGVIEIQFEVTRGAGVTEVNFYYVALKLAINVDMDNTSYGIDDVLQDPDDGGAVYNTLEIDTAADSNGTGLCPGCKYSIIKYIYKHIDTDEEDRLIKDDDLVTITAAATIEHTSGLSSRHFTEKTRLDILKTLAHEDKAVFYMALGGTTLTWKKTFADAATEWTDASVLSWGTGELDITELFNEYHVYGMRVEDKQVYVSSADLTTDPGATSKISVGATRTKVIRDGGIFSQYDVEQRADEMVDRDSTMKLYLTATLPGFSTLRLGDQVDITSTLLNLTNTKYTITHWEYDSDKYQTIVRLQPRVSIGYSRKRNQGEEVRDKLTSVKELADSHYPAKIYKQTWSNP